MNLLSHSKDYCTLLTEVLGKVSFGEWLNEKEPIKTLKHRRKVKSIFLYGLECLARILLNSEYFSFQLKFIFHLFHCKNLEIGDY